MILELVGIPGSGKSTLAELLTERFLSEGVSVVTVEDLREQFGLNDVTVQGFVDKFKNLYPDSAAILDSKMDAIKSSNPVHWERSKGWVERILAEFIIHKENNPGLYFWEEGIASRAVNLFAFPDIPVDKKELADFLTEWVYPDVIISVSAESGQCLNRIEGRGLPERLVGLPTEDIKRFLTNVESVIKLIVEEAKNRKYSCCRV